MTIKTIFFALLFAALCHAQPCEDYTCDSAVVRAILDSNGLFDIPVDSVTVFNNGRITKLFFSEKSITTLPPEIANLS